MSTREQPWSDDAPDRGRVLLLTRNPVSEAVAAIARVAGREVTIVEQDEDGGGLAAFEALGVGPGDSVVVCDHDAPDAAAVLRSALAWESSYVAMLASRRRSANLLEELGREGVTGLERLHVPAGLDTGGKSPGEIALSVVAEIVAVSHGRSGGPMRRD